MIHLEEHKTRKIDIYKRYKEGLKDLPLNMNPYLQESDPNFWLTCILIDEDIINNGKVNPTIIREELEKYNAEGRHIWKPMHLQPFFKEYDYIKSKEKSISKDLFERGLCLPSDIKMTAEEQDKIIEIIKKIFL